MKMYENGVVYKFELPNKIFYTGWVVAEDSFLIRIKTLRGENYIINKSNLVSSWDVKEDESS